MEHQMYLRVRISEKASGRIITYTDPDDDYYLFETDQGKISSAGYAEVCCITDEGAVGNAGVVSQSRDAVLTEEQLRGIYEASGGENALLGALIMLRQGGACELPLEWLAEEIPDHADKAALAKHPERYSFEYILEDYNIQKTRNIQCRR